MAGNVADIRAFEIVGRTLADPTTANAHNSTAVRRDVFMGQFVCAELEK
jgi:hypothetical protein